MFQRAVFICFSFFFLLVFESFAIFFLPRPGRDALFDETGMIKMKGRGNIFFFFFGCTLEIVANRERDETWNVKLLSIVEIELRLDALGEPKDLIEREKYFADLNIGWKFLFPLFIDTRSCWFTTWPLQSTINKDVIVKLKFLLCSSNIWCNDLFYFFHSFRLGYNRSTCEEVGHLIKISIEKI